MAFQDGLLKLAADRTMTLTQVRVLLHLLGKLDFENYIHVPQTDVAKALEMQPPNVSAALSALVKKGILLKGPKVGRVTTLRLNDTMAWRGRVRSLQDARTKRLRLAVNNDAKRRDELEKRGQRRLDE